MAMRTRKTIFTQGWVDGLRHVPESGMICTVVITDPDIEDLVLDMETGQYTGGEPTVILGPIKARIQPLRSAVPRDRAGDDARVQTVLVSMPVETLSVPLTSAYRLKVTVSPLNPDLLRYEYRIRELLDSGNPLERTILCDVNQETV